MLVVKSLKNSAPLQRGDDDDVMVFLGNWAGHAGGTKKDASGMPLWPKI